jgi:hypothetical protein
VDLSCAAKAQTGTDEMQEPGFDADISNKTSEYLAVNASFTDGGFYRALSASEALACRDNPGIFRRIGNTGVP